MDENEISYTIRGAIFKVYNELGPGLLESIYVSALEIELKLAKLDVQKEVEIPVYYKQNNLNLNLRLDLLVNNKVIIEVKSVENLNPVHHKQIISYLKISRLKLGILVNFNEVDIKEGIFRKVNGYI